MEDIKSAGFKTPGPPRITARRVMNTPSPVANATLASLNPSSGSLSPLPLICKCRKPTSLGSSPSELPHASKMRAVISQSAPVEPLGFASSEEELSLPSGGDRYGSWDWG